MAFTFAQPKDELHEIAIVHVEGGTNVPLSEQANKRRLEIMAHNREELAIQIFNRLQVPASDRGDAVEPRPLSIIGHEKPWSIDIATARNVDAMVRLFGESYEKTIIMSLQLSLMVDLKKKTRQTTEITVEVGAAGQWQHFESLGKRGKRVAEQSVEAGYHLVVVLDQNTKAYAYQDPDWQAAASYAAQRYLVSQLHADLDSDEVASVRIEPFATEAIVPLNNLMRNQSARGIKVHYMVYGMQFERTESPELIRAPRMELTGEFPTGRVSDDGRRPEFGQTRIRLQCPGLNGRPKVMGGHWYPPSAQPEVESREAAAAGGEWEWPNQRTARRNGLKKKAREATQQARYARQREDGELSDGASSTMSAKLARGLDGMAVTWADRARSRPSQAGGSSAGPTAGDLR